MYNVVYREDFEGVALGRVERDRDFTSSLGFYHNEYQIQYIFRGERLFFYEGVCYPMKEGTLTLIDKRQIAKTCIIGGNYHDRLLIELKEQYAAELGNMLGADLRHLFETHHGVYRVGENRRLQGHLADLEDLVLRDRSDTRGSRIKLQVLQILLDHEQWELEKSPRLTEGVKAHVEKQKRVHLVADYIADHYDSIGSVEELAGSFFMSKAYLCRIFKEVTNFTISEYINLYRIAASRKYLADEKYSMTEIANRLGYDSLTYFERVFKKQLGKSPLQYRKQILSHR